MEDIKLLKQIPIFKDFKITELMNVAMVGVKVHLQENEIVFKEKSKGDALYVIRSGQVRVCKRDSFDEDHVLAYLASGEYFGEMCLVDRGRRSASVFANTDTDLLKIKRTDFRNLIAGDKEIERKFYKSFSSILCERLRVANENLTFNQDINKLIDDIE